MEEFKFYRYFKGEGTNPFDQGELNDAAMFWSYEQIFESKFNKGDFSPGTWKTPTMSAFIKRELKAALSVDPINKEKLFKIWLYNLLMEYLPDKHGPCDIKKFNLLYWDAVSVA